MKILISAGETSSDTHGAALLKAIQKSRSSLGPIEAFGIGGPHLRAAGLKVIVDARELLVMGFSEVVFHLPKIYRALNRVTEEAARIRPDVAVVIDYPDFHFRLARRLRKLGIPVIYYIPPKVWAWRRSRVQILQKFFVKILCIFPFEEAFFATQGVSVKYVGNPLVDELPLHLTQVEARKKLNLAPKDAVFLLMPGSRASELKAHLALMIEAAHSAALTLRELHYLDASQPLKILIPFPVTVDVKKMETQIRDQISFDPLLLNIQIFQGNSAECLVAADAGLIKSGTSTLEAGLLQCPHVIVYKPSWTTAWIFKNLIRYRGPVGLVNLVAGCQPNQDYLVPEFLCEKVTLATLKKEIIVLLTDEKIREKMKQGFQTLRDQLCETAASSSPSARAAQEVISFVQSRSNQAQQR